MPRATTNGDGERVERWALANGAAVQVHWPAGIDADDFEDLNDWLDLVKRKILRAVPAGDPRKVRPDWIPEPLSTPIPAESADWREQRERTKEALKDRIVEAPASESAFQAPEAICLRCGVTLQKAYSDGIGWRCQTAEDGIHVFGSPSESAFHYTGPLAEPAPPTDLRKYFNGCGCAECVANYGVAGVQYIDASAEGYVEHLNAHNTPAQPIVAPDQYFQGCKCKQCKANRPTGVLVWAGSLEHQKHMAQREAAEASFFKEAEPF